MKADEIKKDIKSSIGSWINISEFARYMRWGRDRARLFLSDIPCVEGRYFAGDVAKKLCERRR